MLKRLSRKTNFVLIWIVIGLFVGVSINQAFGGTDPTIVDQRNGNLAVNIANVYQNGLLVPYGNVGIGVVNPTVKLDVNGYVKSTTAFCIGNTCIDENQLKTILGVHGTVPTDPPTTPMTTSTHRLPPTGITHYSDRSTNTADASVAADTGAFPRQDARYARPFDYTKIANDGSILPATATLGTGAKDWACTKDNITGLTWEVKTTSGLRNQAHTYSWYKTNGTTDGKSLGVPSTGTCETSGRCDTEKYVEDVNAVGLCGMKDWVMPTVGELQGIVDFGSFRPAIDTQYFPDTPTAPSRYNPLTPKTNNNWWTGVPDSNSMGGSAWLISFVDGQTSAYTIAASNVFYHIRLVRNSPTLQPHSAGQCKAGLNNSPNNPNSKYTISNNGTVTDEETNLMWKRCSEGQTWNSINNSCEGESWGTVAIWSEALTSAVNDRTGGYNNWRLPNIKELNSIVEFCTDGLARNLDIFPQSMAARTSALQHSAYWSSTPALNINKYTILSWYIESGNGGSALLSRMTQFYVRLVRDVTTSP